MINLRLITTKAKVYWLVFLGFVLGFIAGYFLGASLFKAQEVKATGFSLHTVWSPYGPWSDWGECRTQSEETCGVVSGSQVRHRTRVCILVPGGGQNQCAFGTTQQQNQERECEVELEACEEPKEPQLCEDSTALNFGSEDTCRYHGASAPPPATECVAPRFAPTILGWERLSPTSVKVWWSKIDEGVNDFVVWFGLEKGNLPWNEVVKDSFETTLNDLPFGQHIWVGAQGDSNGCRGLMGDDTDP